MVLLLAVSLAVQHVSAESESDSCASGQAVEEPANSPELVSDCASLLAARDRLAGGVGLNWSADRPIEEWDRVTLSEQEGGEEEDAPVRVIGLDLDARGLSGRIPPELGDLNSLQLLSLSNNRFTGTIPAWIADLTDLVWLDLRGNGMTGTIPT